MSDTAVRDQIPKGRPFTALPNVNWEAIRLDYISGRFTYAQLAQKYGVKQLTIEGRARRKVWKMSPKATLTNVVANTVQAAVRLYMPAVLSVQQDKWKEKELAAATRIVSVVEDRDMSDVSARDLSSLSGALDSASRVGRRALDMDTEGQVAAFASGLCSGMQIQRGPAPLTEQPAQVIEVQSDAVSTDHPDSQPS